MNKSGTTKELNIRTNITPEVFQSNLISNGFHIKTKTDKVTVLTDGKSYYAIYGRASLQRKPGVHYAGPDGKEVKYILDSP